jgi:hypothetical protein
LILEWWSIYKRSLFQICISLFAQPLYKALLSKVFFFILVIYMIVSDWTLWLLYYLLRKGNKVWSRITFPENEWFNCGGWCSQVLIILVHNYLNFLSLRGRVISLIYLSQQYYGFVCWYVVIRIQLKLCDTLYFEENGIWVLSLPNKFG